MIRRHPNMQMSLMRAQRSSIARVPLPADTPIKFASDRSSTNTWAHWLKNGILESSSGASAPYKMPTLAAFVLSLAGVAFGKLVRI